MYVLLLVRNTFLCGLLSTRRYVSSSVGCREVLLLFRGTGPGTGGGEVITIKKGKDFGSTVGLVFSRTTTSRGSLEGPSPVHGKGKVSSPSTCASRVTSLTFVCRVSCYLTPDVGPTRPRSVNCPFTVETRSLGTGRAGGRGRTPL